MFLFAAACNNSMTSNANLNKPVVPLSSDSTLNSDASDPKFVCQDTRPVPASALVHYRYCGVGMQPTYTTGDVITYDSNSGVLKRGDIVVYQSPKNNSSIFVDRIIGLPGEKIKIKNNQIQIFNQSHPAGFILNESYLSPNINTFSDNQTDFTLTAGQFFVMGDNRLSSFDSRLFGFLDQSLILGKAVSKKTNTNFDNSPAINP